jgi:succinoglycan biosynthesis transport protein ExoP
MLNHVSPPSLPAGLALAPAEPPPFAWLPGGLAFLRRNLMLITLSALPCFGAGLGYVMLATSQYTATNTLVIDSRRTHPTRAQPINLDAQSENAFVESQVEVLRGQGTLRAVVDRLALDRDPRFWDPEAPQNPLQATRAAVSALLRGPANMEGLAAGDEARATAARILARNLDIRRVGMTAVVEVSYTSPSRSLSASVANAVAAAYIGEQLGSNAETTRRAGGWLEERIRELRGNALTADRAVQEYKAANNIIDLGPALLSDQELTDTIELVAAARARFAEASARAQRLEVATPAAVLQGSVAEALQSQVINRLRQQFLDSSRREAELAGRHGVNHGAAVQLRTEMVEIERAIQNELGRIAEVHRNERQVAQGNMHGMEAQLAGLVQTATRMNIERSQLRSLQSTADASRAIFENFLQRFTQAMQDQSYPIADARSVSLAIPPLERSKPRSLIILAAALAIGLMLGVGLAILRDALDGRLRTADELADAASASRVWVVGEARRLRVVGRDPWRNAATPPPAFCEAVNNPASPMAEAVQGLRSTIARLSAQGGAIKVIGVASTQGGDGASLVAANLAMSLAASGRRIALLDWNGGMSGKAFTVAETGLDVVPMPPIPEGREAAQWRDAAVLIAGLRQTHDLVILDLPALSSLGSAVALHEMVEGFILVARWGRTPRREVSEAMARMTGSDALFLGAVLNRADIRQLHLHGAARPRQTLEVRV